MNKVTVVATTELASALRTKSFLVSLLMLPIIWGAAIAIQVYGNRADTKPRPFAVVDRSGVLAAIIHDAAQKRNAAIVGADGKPKASRFVPEIISPAGRAEDAILLELSDRVRREGLFAFAEIPATILEAAANEATPILYHSDNPNYDDLRNWLTETVNAEVRARRYRAAGIDPTLAARLERTVGSENLGLLTRVERAGQTARIAAAEKVDKIRTFVVPAVLMFVVFMVVMTTAPQLLNSVIEEKMSRISEVLLGSVSPFELMMGKLLGSVAVALVLAGLYVAAGYGVAAYYGYADAVSPSLLVALGFFLVLGALFYGSLYMAVGSACSELKDAQSLMMPVMLLSMLPAFLWSVVITNPASHFSVGVSLFPPATPFLMLMRMAMQPAPPAWQIALGVGLTTLTAVAAVWAAGKILRTGLLMQGKAPTFGELVRWVLAR